MSDYISPVKKYQDEIDGKLVARMILNFHHEFREVYPERVHIGLGAVGPMQTFIGLAIKNGLLSVTGSDK